MISPFDVRRCCDRCQSEDLDNQPFPLNLMRFMTVCPQCGSKRCAKAKRHDNNCSMKMHPVFRAPGIR